MQRAAFQEESVMGRLDGKVALISGGARGQGACEARMFCREGAHVVFGDILDEAGTQVEAEIRAAGGEAAYVHLNVTSEADWRAAVETAERRYGRLHALVAVPSSISPRPLAWWGVPVIPRPTPPPRALCVSLLRLPLSNTPRTTSAATPCTPVPLPRI